MRSKVDGDAPDLLAIVAAISDGEDIDWEREASGAFESRTALLRSLQIVAGVAELHRLEHGNAPSLGPLEGRDRGPGSSPIAPPSHLGRYRIVRHIAQGGMGAVYEAEQDRPRRTVALKVIRPGYASASALRRFELESQVLARLHHPGIAQIYDAGTEELGNGPQPYFAMELVRGRSLLEYVRESRLDTRARIELMAKVADAVEHAHRKAIVHRDLKPANILVDETGQPKVLDFGVARITDSDVQATMGTDTGQLVGTLSYMSPEQIAGDPSNLDARSDVYSLGVVLYEMLAGRLPYETSGKMIPEVAQAVREQEPARLSSIDRAFRGDVETIAAKALEKERGRRYQSAADFAEDLRRYLRGEPIAARHPTTLYKIAKFSRRNPGLLVGIVVAVFALIAGMTIGIAVQTGLAARLFGRGGQQPRDEALHQARLQMTRLTTMANVNVGSLSPDGRYVAYVSYELGASSLWLKDLTNETVRQIQPPADASYWALRFSHDSASILFTRENHDRPVGGRTYRMPLPDGPPVELAIMANVIAPSPDGRSILLTRSRNNGQRTLFIADADMKNERLFLLGQPVRELFTGAWSPDGKSIAYVYRNHDPSDPHTGIVEREIVTGKERPILTRALSGITSLVWLQDGSGFVVTARDGSAGNGQLWHVSYADGAVRRLTQDLNNYSQASVTADGKRLLAVSASLPSRVWVASLSDPESAKPIVPGAGAFSSVTWTPAGELLYSVGLNGETNIWTMAPDGGHPRQLTKGSRVNTMPTVSADGRYIVFVSTRSGDMGLWRMDADGTNPLQLTNEYAWSPSISPDERWVVYGGYAKGLPVVLRVPLEGGPSEQVTDPHSGRPAISPDGKWLAFEELDETVLRNHITLKPFTGGASTILSIGAGPDTIHWSPDSRGIVYAHDTEILLSPIDGGPTKRLVHSPFEVILSFGLSFDGRKIAYISGQHNSDLILFDDFS